MPRRETTGAIVQRLRLARRPQGEEWRIHALAYEAGISEKTWRRVEGGDSYELGTLLAIASVLEVSAVDLDPELTGAEDEPSQLDRIEGKLDAVRELLAEAARRDREGFLRALSDLLDPPDGTRNGAP